MTSSSKLSAASLVVATGAVALAALGGIAPAEPKHVGNATLRAAWCEQVVDGDTFDFEVYLGYNLYLCDRFRLNGVDACEVRKYAGVTEDEVAKGKEARDFLIGAMEGKHVLLNSLDKKDKYGRWLCDVTLVVDEKEVDLSQLLRERGWVPKEPAP